MAVAPAWPRHGFCSAASRGTRAGGTLEAPRRWTRPRQAWSTYKQPELGPRGHGRDDGVSLPSGGHRLHGRLKEEAPYAYKEIAPVIETIEQAGIARRVARLWPLLTVKG